MLAQPPRILNSGDAQVPSIKWHSIVSPEQQTSPWLVDLQILKANCMVCVWGLNLKSDHLINENVGPHHPWYGPWLFLTSGTVLSRALASAPRVSASLTQQHKKETHRQQNFYLGRGGRSFLLRQADILEVATR